MTSSEYGNAVVGALGMKGVLRLADGTEWPVIVERATPDLERLQGFSDDMSILGARFALVADGMARKPEATA